MRNVLLVVSLVLGSIILLSCGEKAPEDKLVGMWEAPGMGRVEFKADGTVEIENETDPATWELVAGEPHILRMIEGDDPEDAEELDLIFRTNNEITLSEEGATIVLKRVVE
ncbi:hypothetical protein GF402_05520 [Candidatus Fermentibacteria bacterium]|nr:hypothetical protein [Candidatus Fermentibacteria bacterium]